jgi:hypothetical protein
MDQCSEKCDRSLTSNSSPCSSFKLGYKLFRDYFMKRIKIGIQLACVIVLLMLFWHIEQILASYYTFLCYKYPACTHAISVYKITYFCPFYLVGRLWYAILFLYFYIMHVLYSLIGYLCLSLENIYIFFTCVQFIFTLCAYVCQVYLAIIFNWEFESTLKLMNSLVYSVYIYSINFNYLFL